jgi:hypothetical protein
MGQASGEVPAGSWPAKGVPMAPTGDVQADADGQTVNLFCNPTDPLHEPPVPTPTIPDRAAADAVMSWLFKSPDPGLPGVSVLPTRSPGLLAALQRLVDRFSWHWPALRLR